MIILLVQIVIFLAGLGIALRGKLAVTRTRLLSRAHARGVGLGFCKVAVLPFIIPWRAGELALLTLVGAFAAVSMVAFALSRTAPGVGGPGARWPTSSHGPGATCVACLAILSRDGGGSECHVCGGLLHRACAQAHQLISHSR